MLHLHDFDHVKVDELVGTSLGDCQDGVDDDVGQDVGHFAGELGGQRGFGHVDEELPLLMGIRLALRRGNFEILVAREGIARGDEVCIRKSWRPMCKMVRPHMRQRRVLH